MKSNYTQTNYGKSQQTLHKGKISICHNQIKSIKNRMSNTRQELTSILPLPTFKSLEHFLKQRDKKYNNLMKESNQQSKKDRGNWVINLSQKPLTESERSILEKSPKFAMAPTKIPYKNIVAEIEASIAALPNKSRDIIRTNAASILDRARIPTHKNVTASEKKALKDLKSD